MRFESPYRAQRTGQMEVGKQFSDGPTGALAPSNVQVDSLLLDTLTAAHLEQLPDAVFILDSDQRIVWCNSAAERLYGCSRNLVVDRYFNALLRHSQPVAPQNRAAAILSSRVSEVLTAGRFLQITRAGREITAFVTLIPLGDAQAPHGSIAIIRDDREYSQLTTSLQFRLQFESLLTNLSARFSSLPDEEIDGAIEVWLRMMMEILDVDRASFAELTSKGSLLFTHCAAGPGVVRHPAELADDVLPWLSSELKAGRTVALSRVPEDLPPEAATDSAYMVASGMKAAIAIPINIAGSLVCVLKLSAFREARNWSNEIIARLHVAGEAFANAIARRESNRQLHQQQQELTHVARVAAMGEMASVIAHELDQPLTAIVSNAEAARYLLEQSEPDTPEAIEALHDVVDSAMRASQIIKRERRLLKKTPQTMERIDLNETIREIELFLRAEAKHHSSKLAMQLTPGLLPITGDQIQLQQVLLNLARNGLQAMNHQPVELRHLTLESGIHDGQAVIRVIDAGPPIDQANFERMFEPFYTTKPSGLGMGLSISKSILDAHHARIRATRNPTGGVTMSVTLPLASRKDANDNASDA